MFLKSNQLYLFMGYYVAKCTLVILCLSVRCFLLGRAVPALSRVPGLPSGAEESGAFYKIGTG